MVGARLRLLASARTASCLSNLRQLGNAQQIYIGSAQGWGVPDLQGMATTEWPREQWNENPNFRRGIGVKAGEERTFAVREERDVAASVALSNSPDDQVRYFMSLSEATPALKQKLSEALRLKGAWDGQRRELAQVQADLTRLGADQDRIRKNLRETPKEAEVYQTYLKKLSDQEKEIDALTARQKKLMEGEFAAKKAYDDYLAALTTE